MHREDWNLIFAQIAQEDNVTPAHVRAEMEAAVKIAQNSNDPSTRAKWASIPHKGDSVSLEEFLDYVLAALDQLLLT